MAKLNEQGERVAPGYAPNVIIPRLTLGADLVREETVRHHLNRYNFAASYVQIGGRAVDLCCGTGYGTNILREAGADAVGVELSAEAIAHARAVYPGAAFSEGRVQDFLRNRGQRRPQVVTFFEAIEHIPREDGHDVLDAVREALRQDGHLFVSTPRDIRADVNPDHITQWEFDELHAALASRFGEVEMFGQDWNTGEFVREAPAAASFFVARCSQPLA